MIEIADSTGRYRLTLGRIAPTAGDVRLLAADGTVLACGRIERVADPSPRPRGCRGCGGSEPPTDAAGDPTTMEAYLATD